MECQHLTTHDLKLMGTIQTDNNGLRIKLVSDGKGWAIVRPLTLLQHEKLLSKLTIYSVPLDSPTFLLTYIEILLIVLLIF